MIHKLSDGGQFVPVKLHYSTTLDNVHYFYVPLKLLWSIPNGSNDCVGGVTVLPQGFRD